MCWKRILKSPRFSPLSANLAQVWYRLSDVKIQFKSGHFYVNKKNLNHTLLTKILLWKLTNSNFHFEDSDLISKKLLDWFVIKTGLHQQIFMIKITFIHFLYLHICMFWLQFRFLFQVFRCDFEIYKSRTKLTRKYALFLTRLNKILFFFFLVFWISLDFSLLIIEEHTSLLKFFSQNICHWNRTWFFVIF